MVYRLSPTWLGRHYVSIPIGSSDCVMIKASPFDNHFSSIDGARVDHGVDQADWPKGFNCEEGLGCR